MLRKLVGATAIVLLGSTIAFSQESSGLKNLTGKVIIDGSSTVAPISIKVADDFINSYPNVKIPVGVSGTGGGFKRFVKGDTDISDASRPIKSSELKQCRENQVTFFELPVAYDGLTIVVSKDNDWCEQLTVDELKKIFKSELAAKIWSDINPQWPNEEIKIFAPGTDSGTFDYFKEVVSKDGAIRADMSVSEDDHQLVKGVANNANAIGFFGAAYYFTNTDKLKAVKIVNPKTEKPVAPSVETIASGEYAPFSRPLFIYVNAESAKRPEVKVFVNYYLSNAGELASSAGYVSLPDDVYKQVKTNMRRRATGTHFLTNGGEKRIGSLVDVYNKENLIK